MTTTNQEIFYCKSRGLKIPIRFDIFKHGGGIYLALVNQAEGVHLPLISTGPAMIAELRRVADAIERAVAGNEQAVIGCPLAHNEIKSRVESEEICLT